MIMNVKVGDIIKDNYAVAEEGQCRRVVRDFRVVQVFPNVVLTNYVVFNGFENVTLKRCFCYGDLVQRGLEMSNTYFVNASEVIQRTDYDLEVGD